MPTQSIFCALLLFVATFAASCGQDAPSAPEASILSTEKPPASSTSDPQLSPPTGQGNFENLVADYESKDRVIWQQPDLVISLLGDLEGKTVADIGAGTGYFTFRMVPRAAKVIGIDIDPRCINFMDSVKVRLPEKYRDRFECRLARPDNPLLKTNEADAVTIVNTYGYISNRVAYLRTLQAGMAPSGQLLIIDFKKNNLPVGPADEFKVALTDVEKELIKSGFEISKIDIKTLDYQYIIIAKKPAAVDR